jgi:hypothetical protein
MVLDLKIFWDFFFVIGFNLAIFQNEGVAKIFFFFVKNWWL